MPEIQPGIIAGIGVGAAEMIGYGPCLERCAIAPDGMRGEQGVVVLIRPPQQSELNEPVNVLQERIPVAPRSTKASSDPLTI